MGIRGVGGLDRYKSWAQKPHSAGGAASGAAARCTLARSEWCRRVRVAYAGMLAALVRRTKAGVGIRGRRLDRYESWAALPHPVDGGG